MAPVAIFKPFYGTEKDPDQQKDSQQLTIQLDQPLRAVVESVVRIMKWLPESKVADSKIALTLKAPINSNTIHRIRISQINQE